MSTDYFAEAMRRRWYDLCLRMNRGMMPQIEGTWRIIHFSYAEPHRLYHALRHIGYCLDRYEEYKASVQISKHGAFPETELALWLHDLRYDFHRNDNEHESSLWAGVLLKSLLLDDVVCTQVSHLICQTKHDRPSHLEQEGKIVLDVDLAHFAKPFEEFAVDTQRIRLEYDWVPKAEFCKKRAEILQGFLDRPRIYQTDYFYEKYEAKARENLKRSIEQLKTGV